MLYVTIVSSGSRAPAVLAGATVTNWRCIFPHQRFNSAPAAINVFHDQDEMRSSGFAIAALRLASQISDLSRSGCMFPA